MKVQERSAAISLRKRGRSLKEISSELKVAKSTVSLWLRDVKLSKSAQGRLHRKLSNGQSAAVQRNRELFQQRSLVYSTNAKKVIANSNQSKENQFLLLALVYWCEGNKNPSNGIQFTNADPHLMRLFITLLRSAFELDEKKFRGNLHIHEYHDTTKQLAFWSKVTNIPIRQFTKPYLKPHTSKRIHEGYEGCLGLKYYDARVSRQLMAIAKEYLGV